MYRIIGNNILDSSKDVIVLFGSRQVGKTTLLKNYIKNAEYINLEVGQFIEILNSRDIESIRNRFLTDKTLEKKILILDAFQKLENPGLIAKIIHDEIPEIKLIITGSSALELSFKASESLAGRKRTYSLFPLTFSEYLIQKEVILETAASPINFEKSSGSDEYKGYLLETMRYGLYPELLNRESEKERYLLEYTDSTLLRDIFYLELVRNTTQLKNLLKLLAYQIGQQVNISDISDRLGISRMTVSNYIDILKKSFVIFTLSPFTKKRRDEIGKTEKIYFYDLGVRNAIINDFSPVEFRHDYGSIFENYVITEMIKLNEYYQQRYNFYYWRTKQGAEVDVILEKDGKLKALEIKVRGGTVSRAFKETYPNAETFSISLDNLSNYLLK